MPLYAGLISLPLLRGTIATPGPWQTYYARSAWRVYPYQVGSAVASSVTEATALPVSSYAEFSANDWILLCEKKDYGSSTLFIPNMNRIRKISSFGTNEATDPDSATGTTQLNLSSAITTNSGDWVLCLGADTASDPSAQPNWDGSEVTIYTDPVGDSSSSLDYLLTGSGGTFRGWVDSGRVAVDLLVIDGTSTPRIALPLFELGPEIVE